MSRIRPIPTEYRGVVFRSKLEAQWAVYFDMCGADWEYEPQGFDCNGVWYLPDFVIHNVVGRPFYDKPGDLWIEVKGVMSEKDEEKICRFASGGRSDNRYGAYPIENPILVLGRLPMVCDADDLVNDRESFNINNLFFNYETIDHDGWSCFIGLNQNNRFTLMEPDKPGQYRNDEDWDKTVRVLNEARNYRFDHRQFGRG